MNLRRKGDGFMAKDARMTILVVGYDPYVDVWDGFFACKQKNWPNCPFETVLSNNELEYAVEDVRLVHCGNAAQWSTRARLALQTIKTKYVCLMLEDFFILEQVNNNDVFEALDLMDKENILYYKLDTFTKIKTRPFHNIEHLRCIPKNLKYGVSLLAAIWEKEHLLSVLGEEDYNAWIFEMERNEEAQAAQDNTDTVGVFDTRNILNICHMVVQSQYLPNAVKAMKQKGYMVDCSKRKVMPPKAYFVYRMSNQLALISRKYPLVRKLARLVGVRTATDKQIKK